MLNILVTSCIAIPAPSIEYIDLPTAVDILLQEFSSEREMCDYIEAHLELVCFEILKEAVKWYKRELRISGRRSNSQRVDL